MERIYSEEKEEKLCRLYGREVENMYGRGVELGEQKEMGTDRRR